MTKYKLLFFIILLVFTGKIEAHNTNTDIIDSLNSKNDIEKIDYYIAQANKSYTSMPYNSLKYSKEALKLSLKNDYKESVGKAYMLMGVSYHYLSNMDSALISYKSALVKFNSNKDTISVAKVFMNIASIYSQQDSNLIALEMYENALRKFELLGDNNMVSLLLNSIGRINLKLFNYDKAIDNLMGSLVLSESIKDTMAYANSLYMLGVIHTHTGDYEISEDYYKKAIQAFKSIDSYIYVYHVKSSLANLYKDINEDDKALKLYSECVTYSEKSSDKVGLAYALYGKGSLYIKNKQYNKADKVLNYAHKIFSEIGNHYTDGEINTFFAIIQYKVHKKNNKAVNYFNKAIEISAQDSNYSDLSFAYKSYSEFYESINNYKLANNYLKKYIKANNALLVRQNKQKLDEVRVKYQTKLQKKKNLLLELSLANEKDLKSKSEEYTKLLILFITILVALVIMLIILVFAIRKLDKKKLRISTIEKENVLKDLQRNNVEIVAKALLVSKAKASLSKLSKSISSNKDAILNDDKKVLKKIDLSINKTKKELNELSQIDKELKVTNVEFYNKLLEIDSSFTPTELKICTFLQINMTTKEICDIIYRSTRTVEGFRYNIRKKLNLDSDTNLNIYLMKLYSENLCVEKKSFPKN